MEIKRLQRRFNTALSDGDTDMAVEAGIELVKAINGKSKPSKTDLDYRKIIEAMLVLEIAR